MPVSFQIEYSLLCTLNSLRIEAIKSYKNYKMTLMHKGYVENALTLFSAWLRLFRYVAKMAAVDPYSV